MAADGGNKTVQTGSIKVGVISGDIITRQVFLTLSFSDTI